MSRSPNYFFAHNKYALIYITEYKDVYTIQFQITDYIFKDNITALHVHSNNDGKPGPILIWLLTSPKWQSGVTQSTPGKNYPCCVKISGSRCDLTAPYNTLLIENVECNTLYEKIVEKNICEMSCPGLTIQEPFGFLVVHGNNYQIIEQNGCLSNGTPGIDVLMATPLTKQTIII